MLEFETVQRLEMFCKKKNLEYYFCTIYRSTFMTIIIIVSLIDLFECLHYFSNI